MAEGNVPRNISGPFHDDQSEVLGMAGVCILLVCLAIEELRHQMSQRSENNRVIMQPTPENSQPMDDVTDEMTPLEATGYIDLHPHAQN